MASDEVWLLDQGFRVEAERDSSSEYWAHLIHRDNPDGRAPDYGRGPTSEASIRSAGRRHEIGRLGIEPTD